MTAKKGKQSEGEVTKGVRGILKVLQIFHWKQWQGPMSQPTGVSYILGIRRVKVADLVKAGVKEVGVFMAIEMKHGGWAPPGETADSYRHYAEQREFLRAVRGNGGIGFFCTGIEGVIRALGAEDRFIEYHGSRKKGG